LSQSSSSEFHEGFARAALQIHLKTVLHGHNMSVDAVHFTPDGRLLASIATDGIRIWDVSEGTLQAQIDEVFPMGADFSLRNNYIAAVVEGGIVRVWTIDGMRIIDLPGHEVKASGTAFSPTGSLLVTGDGTGKVRVWDVGTWQLLCSFQGGPHGDIEPPTRSLPGATDLTFSPDGEYVAMRSQDSYGVVQVWRIADTTGPGCAEWVGAVGEPHRMTWPLAFSPDGRFLAVPVNGPDVIWLFESQSWALAGILSIPGNETAKSISFSPDGHFLAAAGGLSGVVWFWEILNQQLIGSFEAHTEGYSPWAQEWAIGGIDWARNSRLLATSGMSHGTLFDSQQQRYLGPPDYTIKIWEVNLLRGSGSSINV